MTWLCIADVTGITGKYCVEILFKASSVCNERTSEVIHTILESINFFSGYCFLLLYPL